MPPGLGKAISQIDEITKAELDKDKLGSVTVGIVSGQNLVWTKSYGFADMEKKIPADKETVYRIGSITKMFTALMLLQLVENGKANLSDPVEKYLPAVNRIKGRFRNAPPITLIQLATHTSGLATEPSDRETYLKGSVADWEKVLISALPNTRYDYEPGTKFNYSNVGYAILGAALSRAAREPYTGYIRRRVFLPLEMKSSAFEPSAQIKIHLSKGYAVDDDGKLNSETPESEHQGRGYRVPNGAMYSTVEDLARFVSLELGEEKASVIKKETVQENFSRRVLMNDSLSSGYGLGFEVFRRDNVLMFGHGGSVSGYQSGILFNRKMGMGIIVLRNVSGGAFNIGGFCMNIFSVLAALN